jgi:hypothetical protein
MLGAVTRAVNGVGTASSGLPKVLGQTSGNGRGGRKLGTRRSVPSGLPSAVWQPVENRVVAGSRSREACAESRAVRSFGRSHLREPRPAWHGRDRKPDVTLSRRRGRPSGTTVPRCSRSELSQAAGLLRSLLACSGRGWAALACPAPGGPREPHPREVRAHHGDARRGRARPPCRVSGRARQLTSACRRATRPRHRGSSRRRCGAGRS